MNAVRSVLSAAGPRTPRWFMRRLFTGCQRRLPAQIECLINVIRMPASMEGRNICLCALPCSINLLFHPARNGSRQADYRRAARHRQARNLRRDLPATDRQFHCEGGHSTCEQRKCASPRMLGLILATLPDNDCHSGRRSQHCNLALPWTSFGDGAHRNQRFSLYSDLLMCDHRPIAAAYKASDSQGSQCLHSAQPHGCAATTPLTLRLFPTVCLSMSHNAMVKLNNCSAAAGLLPCRCQAARGKGRAAGGGKCNGHPAAACGIPGRLRRVCRDRGARRRQR